MNSMTGFGKGSFETESKIYTIEARSVNHRFIEVKIRLPKGLLSIEEKIDKAIKNTFKRGTFSIYLDIRNNGTSPCELDLDLSIAESYFQAAEKVKNHLGMTSSLSLQDILRYPDVIKSQGVEEEDVLWPAVSNALNEALKTIGVMRRLEGEALKTDLLKRLQLISKTLEVVDEDSLEVVKDYQIRLRERIESLLDQVPVNEDRIAYEVAAFADKSSITEELVRLRIHIKEFERLLNDEDAVGRKLDFLIQEMNREINTIGSKSSVTTIANAVVILKSELEKIREQVQNIE
ncbi:hypothetical protein AZF37_04295 [endosymbiont 'TC1' of Trimyema compressum]|uniref:YicC/YloC family endoribonuclease n=1 Tax=endosymbiont 'TC1' of Trimyema compressum TaxID=243899 RepID=UPI0007F09DF0|nr:YicC/YloC family endoribonuclease [endosymbiont 'TC1' of Trimyema compressum]AMP20489.1 hypothetical protein AZF37_04295 [endosymbiont 'TC1' of Trimyema compressum]